MKSVKNRRSVVAGEEAAINAEPTRIRLSSLEPKNKPLPGPDVLASLSDSVRDLSAIPATKANQERGATSAREKESKKVAKRMQRVHKRPPLGFD